MTLGEVARLDEQSAFEAVTRTIREVLEEGGRRAPDLNAKTCLDELDMDSLDWAVTLAKLEDVFGFDPFLEGRVDVMPKTVADLVACYWRE